jgi:hypothetical protein
VTRARLALLAAGALVAGCTSSKSSTQGAQLRQPSAIAMFTGYTLHDPSQRLPYLAIANAGRNDLTVVDARTDTVVEAPVQLRPLAIPFPDRPALLASAELGDGMADLLVGVSAGSSVLQLVETWTVANAVDGDVSPTGGAVDLGDDVLAIVPLPAQPAGTARLAAALAGGRLAVVDYARSGSGEAIVKGASVVQDVGFQAVALATVPGDGAHVYAATLDPIGPGAIQGVAEIDVSGTGAWPVRALDARAPTRLVAAARLAERKRNALETNEDAFAGQTPVTRVYAVLDEGGCGPGRRIDCGIVALDPAKVPGVGDDHIPDDDWSQENGASWMPYRAPIRFDTARPLVIAVAAPPAVPPADATYPAGFMRLQLDADSPTATTAVGVVATDSGALEFLDLGRFEIASRTPLPVAAKATAVLPPFVNTGDETNRDETRLWLKDAGGAFPETAELGALAVGITPGYTQSASWTVKYQGILPGLELRAAEAGWDGANLWLAIQIGEGPVGSHVTSQVARLYHPALGVAAGDVVVIRNRDGAGNPICTLAPPPGSTTEAEDFEARVAGLLPPTADRPGGAVSLQADTSSAEWVACFDALQQLAQASPPELVRLLVTIRSGGLLLVRNLSQYAGRPELDTDYVLRYRDPAGPDEDALAAACPLADWDGVFLPPPAPPPPACDTACRTDCEALVLARLARRVHHLAENCDTAPGTGDPACLARYSGETFPFLNGPAVKFRVGVEVGTIGIAAPHREHSLTFGTQSGMDALADRPDGTTVQANGALVFDRSPHDAAAGYRFFVSYPGNQVVDVSPMVSPIARIAIR